MAVISRRSERRAAEAEAEGPSRVPRTRVAAARGAWAVGSGMLAVARLIRLVAGIVALIIVAAIVLRLLGANPGNVVVRDIHDVAGTLVGPFKNLFSIKNAKLGMAVNWGIAAVVYLAVGALLAGLIARMAPRGVHPARPVV